MAAANEIATASISKKISLGGGTYMYLGTIAFGSEYKTGGNTLANTVAAPVAGERYSLPERIDFMDVEGQGGYALTYAPGTPGTIQAWWTGTALKGVFEQVAAATNVGTLVKNAPFVCIGN